MSGYHKFECGMLKTIWVSGSSINCNMALRMISCRPLSYFKGMQAELRNEINFDDVKR